ncbi:hypothetical protein PG997_000044 [Apiospora hydei]|uniref:Uncharacterized protein n=1 Tax=Apiospora hydei TaxID=1337664 RepID=A0ABR1X9Q0_9PEZI
MLSIRTAAIAFFLLALAGLAPSASAAPAPVRVPVGTDSSPIVEVDALDTDDRIPPHEIVPQGLKPWPPKYYCDINGPQPGC